MSNCLVSNTDQVETGDHRPLPPLTGLHWALLVTHLVKLFTQDMFTQIDINVCRYVKHIN